MRQTERSLVILRLSTPAVEITRPIEVGLPETGKQNANGKQTWYCCCTGSVRTLVSNSILTKRGLFRQATTIRRERYKNHPRCRRKQIQALWNSSCSKAFAMAMRHGDDRSTAVGGLVVVSSPLPGSPRAAGDRLVSSLYCPLVQRTTYLQPVIFGCGKH